MAGSAQSAERKSPRSQAAYIERIEGEIFTNVGSWTGDGVSPEAAECADDGLAPASDLKANFLGHLNRIYGKSAQPPPGGLKGDYGFIVD